MKKGRFPIIIFLLILSPLFSQQEDGLLMPVEKDKSSGIKLSGLLRNDAFYTRMPDSPIRPDLFSDILETRLVLERDQDDWSFYADGRFYIYSGEIQKIYGLTRTILMRAYARYFSSIGDFTLGKTYVNFGTPGLFNPFEIDKNYQLTDLTYARQGIYALEYYYPWQDLSGLKVYTGFNDYFNYYPMWGISPGLHIGKFDTGAVWNHSDNDKNTAGIYLKGDAIVGVQASWGASFDDNIKYQRSQVSAGIDYSFFDGHLLTSLIFYFNESGADSYNNYKPLNDSYFLARYYGFFSITWVIDEFWSLASYAFMNFIDYSALLLPSATFVIANGLTANLQVILPVTRTQGEFAADLVGDFSILMRVEGKF